MKGLNRLTCALITGIQGQDGAYLAQLLLKKGYRVLGLVSNLTEDSLWRLKYLGIENKIEYINGNIVNFPSLIHIFKTVKPDELYNLAAVSFSNSTRSNPILSAQVNAMGVLNLIEAIKEHSPETKFFQASSSAQFGISNDALQSEDTPFSPNNPYGISKTYAHWIVKDYRESNSLIASNGILFNHESPLRNEQFVTRKITQSVARIVFGKQEKLILGNIDVVRDWGYAKDYVEAMWLILQHPQPDDYVIATGIAFSVRDFCQKAFHYVGLNYENYLVIDSELHRPSEISISVGIAKKAETVLGWKATTNLDTLVKLMVEADIEREKALLGETI